MKEALECFTQALVCETLAGQAQDASIARALRDIAGQWRKLALDADRHRRLTTPRFVDLPPRHETAGEDQARFRPEP